MAKAGHVNHWKHGWIPISPEAKAIVARRKAAPKAPKVLHRGVSVQFSPDEQRRISDLLQPPVDESQIDQEYKIGDMVIDKLLGYRNANNQQAGIGTHWTSSKDFAKTAADVGDGVPVLITAEWQGDGEDKARTGTGSINGANSWRDEEETTLTNAATLRITSIKIQDGQSMTEVLKTPVTVRGSKRVG